MMVGKKVALNIERPEPVNPETSGNGTCDLCVDKEGVRNSG